MPRTFCRSVASVARELGLPVQTVYSWVRRGRVVLPLDVEMLKQLRKDDRGYYFLDRRLGTGEPSE
jgi:transposase-like protein